MNLTLAYSPCPNDTFAFHAMINNLVDCEGLKFNVRLNDVEELNRGAEEERFDVCKMSYHAFFHISDRYTMLRSGSALGYHNGPILVAPAGSRLVSLRDDELSEELSKSKIAIPGMMTTGALLLKIAFPEAGNLYPVLFSEIGQGVLSGNYDAGVLIHEGRFTYRERGLELLMDLGENWHSLTSMPVPLGGIAVSKRLERETAARVGRVLRRSILFAMENPNLSTEYVSCYAQEMERDIQKKHIELFVNNYTLDIGDEGEAAVKELLRRASKADPQIILRDELFIF
jgi:1,4-dihydroxy-6-naphthoate synthase